MAILSDYSEYKFLQTFFQITVDKSFWMRYYIVTTKNEALTKIKEIYS